jgi:hypothetical protein
MNRTEDLRVQHMRRSESAHEKKRPGSLSGWCWPSNNQRICSPRTLDLSLKPNGCSALPDLPGNLAALQLPAAGQEAHHADQASGLALCTPPVPASRVHPLNLHHKTEARPHSHPKVETQTFNNCTSSSAIHPPSTYSPQRQSSEKQLAGRKVRIEVISQCLTQGSRKATKI